MEGIDLMKNMRMKNWSEKSQTRDVNPDENYLQGEDDDDNPQFTSTPKGNIKMVKKYSIVFDLIFFNLSFLMDIGSIS